MDSSRQTASGSCRQLKQESEQSDRHPEFSKEEAWPTKTFSNWSSDARVVRFFHSFKPKAGAPVTSKSFKARAIRHHFFSWAVQSDTRESGSVPALPREFTRKRFPSCETSKE